MSAKIKEDSDGKLITISSYVLLDINPWLLPLNLWFVLATLALYDVSCWKYKDFCLPYSLQVGLILLHVAVLSSCLLELRQKYIWSESCTF